MGGLVFLNKLLKNYISNKILHATPFITTLRAAFAENDPVSTGPIGKFVEPKTNCPFVVATASAPKTSDPDEVDALASAPITVLLFPVVLPSKACLPIAVLLNPVVLFCKVP